MEMKKGTSGAKKEEMIKPETGKSSPAAGNEYGGRKSERCLAAGFPNGCPPNLKKPEKITDFLNKNPPSNPRDERTMLKLVPPKGFRRDGLSYLRSSPMTAKIRLGNPDTPSIEGLTDLCSNVGLIDQDTFKEHYPKRKVKTEKVKVSGIGKQKTLGYAQIPFWIETKDENGSPISVEMEIEVHVIKDFKPKFLIGLDTFLDYKIDISLPKMTGYLRNTKKGTLSFPLFCPPAQKFRKVKIRSKETVTIPGRLTKAIEIKSYMCDNLDYNFFPSLVWQEGFLPDAQFPNGLISKDMRCIMLKNQSEHPIRLERGQILGEAEAVLFGGMVAQTGKFVHWDDLVQPNAGRVNKKFGTTPPKEVIDDEDAGYEDILCFDAKGREVSRPPRSITEDEVRRISREAKKRQKGERWPSEDHGEQAPSAPMPSKIDETPREPDISTDLSEKQRSELLKLIAEYPEVFSNGSDIGKIDPNFYKATIELNGPLPRAQQNRPVGPGKREVISETIDSLMGWDVVEQSKSATASPVVLVWQNDKWRFCVDFRGLNAVTKGDAYPMLRSDYVFSTLADKKYFSIFDAIKGYHQMEIAEEDRAKTAFITHKGLYQFKRLPFGLKNAPAMFQRMMDQLLGSLRWEAALVYIDDIIIFSNSWENHLAHIRTLLESAAKVGLKFHIGKCRFGYADLTLLGTGLSRYGLHTLEDKVKAITLLSTPKTVGEVHRLVGMFGYYRNFIANFAKICEPLNELKRDRPGDEYNAKAAVNWTPECQKSFDELKRRLSSAPILAHPKYDGRPFILYTDASAIAYAAVLCQLWSCDDYNLDDKEETDPPPMNSFTSTMTSWSKDYIADQMFRKRYIRLQKQIEKAEGDQGGLWDEDGFRLAEDETMRFKSIHGERICLPENRIPDALNASHDVLGHFGRTKTYERLSSIYYRPKLSNIVETYVRFCPSCITNKTTRNKLPGSLAPIDPPKDGQRIPAAFESINMDLIVNLPKSKGFDAILVVVDRFTKTGIFIPTTSNFTAESIAEVFLERVVGRGFLPSKFITDRDPRLINSFWQTICRRLKIDHRKTAAFHAQCDGAAERLNQTLEIALRNYVAPRQNDWSKYLFLIELAYNTAKNTSTGFAPYELLYAQPQDPIERLLRPHIPPAMEDMDENVNETADDMMFDNVTRLKDAQEAIVKAMATQKLYYDRRHGPIPQYKVGDYASIRLDKHPVAIIKRNKLSQQKLPPYKIVEIVSRGRAVKLELPPTISINPIISVQHLEPAPSPSEDPFSRGVASNSKSISQRMSIVNHRDTKTGIRKFRVHWEGLGADRDEWRARKYVDEDLIAEYEERIKLQTFNTVMERCEKAKVREESVDTPFPTKRPTPGKLIERPVLYISRTIKPYEKNYHSTEQELACVSWAMMRLRHYFDAPK